MARPMACFMARRKDMRFSQLLGDAFGDQLRIRVGLAHFGHVDDHRLAADELGEVFF